MNNFNDYKTNLNRAAQKISSYFKATPKYAIVLGSGLSTLADSLEDYTVIPYEEIPGFPKVTVSGHEGSLLVGKLEGIDVVLLKGRFHYYEGHSIDNVVFPIRVLLKLGIKNLILTNAAGGINSEYKPGDLMILTDHIGLFCESPLRGENFDEFGPRFPDQSKVYDFEFVEKIANANNIKTQKGVYAYAKGPMYETPAEIRLLSKLGADAIGMSTVPEAIVAYHGGMRVIGISCITNFAAGILDQPLDHKEVLEVGKLAADRMIKLVKNIVIDR